MIYPGPTHLPGRKGELERMKKLLALMMALALTMGLAACTGAGGESSSAGNSSAGNSSTSDVSTPDASQPDESGDASTPEGGTLVFGTSADYPPFEFHILDENGQDQIVGIDVAVAKKIAEDMGCELKIVDMAFENLLINMGRGDVDFVIAAMELDAEGTRANAADYSDPYYTDEAPLIVVKKGNEGNYSSLEDFAGKTVGAQTATTKADIVTGDMAGCNPLLLATVPDLVSQLVYDKCDAVVLDAAVAEKYVETNDQLVILDNISLGEAAEPYRVWVAKGDPKGLLDSINATIASLDEETMAAIIEEANTQSSEAIG